MIVINKINKSYGHQQVLKDISFTIPRGKCIGIMGESGSGKSTLGRIVAGIEKSSSGEILINNKIRKEHHNYEFVMQVVFQNAKAAVNPNFTVQEVLQEALKFAIKQAKYQRFTKAFHSYTQKEIETYYEELLKSVELEDIDYAQLATSLSGGQLQRLCLARALMLEPDLLILDEALSGLDPLVQQEMLKLLAKIRTEQNMTMFFIAHDLQAVYYLCDALHFMHQGEIICSFDDLAQHSFAEILNANTKALCYHKK